MNISLKALSVAGAVLLLWNVSAHAELCSSLNLRAAPVGVKCTTSEGASYERVFREDFGESWMGPDGLVWSDVVGRGSQKDAVEICKNIGGELPSRAEFERGESNDFRKVLPSMEEYSYWSSLVRPGVSGYYASVLVGRNGTHRFVDVRYDNHSVRCVAR